MRPAEKAHPLMTASGARPEHRGLVWLIGGFAFCPCHLPLTLALLGSLLSGTAAAFLVHDHAFVAGGVVTVIWAAATWRGIHLLRVARRSPQSATSTESPRHPDGIVAYFVATFVASWVWWMGVAPLVTPSLPLRLRELFLLPGVFAPAFVAIAMTARAEGRRGVAALLRGVIRWRVGARWYVFAVVYLVAVKLIAASLYRFIRGTWPMFGTDPLPLLLVAVVLSLPSQAGEEIGWRGYALPRLASRLGLALASVVLGVIWAAWHLPFFFNVASDKTGHPFLPYLLTVTALSVAIAALYRGTNGSVLLTMLMHAAINNTKDIVPSSTPLMSWLTIGVLWVGAVVTLVWMGRGGGLASPRGFGRVLSP